MIIVIASVIVVITIVLLLYYSISNGTSPFLFFSNMFGGR